MPAVVYEVELSERHWAQDEVIAQAKRFNVLVCGRRWGKTEVIKEVLIELALDGFPVGYFTPDYKTLIEVWDALINALGGVVARKNATDRRIELLTGGVIEMWTLDNPNAGRSRKYKVIVIDEAQLISALQRKWRLALRPTLLDFKGSAWFVGTALADTDFAALFEQAGKTTNADKWMRWQRPTSENPYISPAELEMARADTPEDEFRQEYEAVFIPGGAGVFRHVQRAIEAFTKEYGEMPESYHDLPTDRIYQFSTDLASTQDWTVTIIWDVEKKLPVFIDRRQGDYLPQIDGYVKMVEHLKPITCSIEINSNKAVVELLEKRGVPVIRFLTTGDSKKHIIERLQLAFEHSELRIPDFQPLRTELLMFRSKRTPNGHTQYEAASGYHDDCVMSLAIGWNGISSNTWDLSAEFIYE